MSTNCVSLRSPGVSVHALLVEGTDDTSPQVSAAHVLAFSPDGRRLAIEPPEGLTYREALPEIDRRAKEDGGDEMYRRLGVVYYELRRLQLADNKALREEWLTEHVWKAHAEYWGNRQRAAYEAGFAAGLGVLRGELGPRLVDNSVAPASVAPETWDQRIERERRERAEKIRATHNPTPDWTLDRLPFSTAKNVARLQAAGLSTLADVAAATMDDIIGIPYYQHAMHLVDWVTAAGLEMKTADHE